MCGNWDGTALHHQQHYTFAYFLVPSYHSPFMLNISKIKAQPSHGMEQGLSTVHPMPLPFLQLLVDADSRPIQIRLSLFGKGDLKASGLIRSSILTPSDQGLNIIFRTFSFVAAFSFCSLTSLWLFVYGSGRPELLVSTYYDE